MQGVRCRVEGDEAVPVGPLLTGLTATAEVPYRWRMPVPARAAVPRTSRAPGLVPLVRAAHIGPALAVTAVATLLAVGDDLELRTILVVTAAVLAGQLTIGWSNDLLDRGRDCAVGRTDKPLATGELPPGMVTWSLAVAAVACIVASAALGWRSAVVHLVLCVGSGHAYNLGLKATAWSWAPYALAFGSLPAVITLAGASPAWPPGWMIGAAAALGVGAHFLNVLPDLHDDAVTGVRGLPHRLGASASRGGATALLVAGSVMAALGPPGRPPAWTLAALALVIGLGVLALLGRGRTPFRAAVAIALVDVVLLTVASR